MTLLALLLLLTWTTTATAQPDDPPPPPAGNIFGIVEAMWLPELACDLNPGWERIIFDWSAHQPNGPDEFVGFLNIDDRWLREAAACNREIVAVVKQVPAWATDGLPGAGVPRGLYLPIDDPQNLWASFMQQTARYYASRGVHRFIILNEPDIQPGTYGFEFEGSLEDYFMMVKVGYLAAKIGNPAASIHLAGTTYWHDVNSGDRLYTDRLLERIRNDPDAAEHNYYFDALSLHIYFRSDTVYEIVNIYRDLLDRYGFDDKAIWITETNASPNLDPDWPVERPQFQITLEQQAAFVVQAAALGLAAGAERIAVYKFYDQHLPPGGESFGLLNPGNETPRPAFYAWRTVIEHLRGVEDARLAATDQVNVVRLIHAGGQQTVIAWARTAAAITVEVAATSDKAYLLALDGTQTIIRPHDEVYQLTLPGATCESGREGCVVGGPVTLLVQPHNDSAISVISGTQRESLAFE